MSNEEIPLPYIVGWLKAPQNAQALIPGTCEYYFHGKEDLADVIN